ncbi:MAG: helix-turn-helix transcriptional regulator [Chitinophagales bacterium]
MHIGINIKVARIAAGLTQQELADKIGKARPLVSYIEQSGKVNERTLQTICKVLNVSVDDLRNMVNEPRRKYQKSPMQEWESVNRRQQDEIDQLKELVASQKRVIEMLEEKIKRPKR